MSHPDLSTYDPARRRRRELIKALHPDRGGDPATFVEVLAALERPHGPAPEPAADRGRLPATGALRRRRATRTLRSRLPRGVPGSRRYASY